MHRKNLILNISLVLVMTFLFHLPSIAQSADTSVFFRYASTFDQLLPSPYFRLQQYVPDSSSLAVFTGKTAGTSVMKSVSVEKRNGTVQSLSADLNFKYVWDLEGRLTNYVCYGPAQTEPYLSMTTQFLIGKKASDVIVTSNDAPFFTDTVMFQYNRSGWISGARYHSVNRDSDVVVTSNRMYNSQGKLIVATNMNYGRLTGTFLYSYNGVGQLTRRAFATSAGIVLCTDTLEYSYLNEAHSVMKVSHKLKVSGMQNWTLLEEKTVYAVSGKVIAYSDYNDADSNYFYRNYVQYNLRYEYDSLGRVTGEYFGTIIAPDAIRVKYYYGTYMQPDSVVYEEQVVTKKSTYFRVYSRDVREYDNSTGFIQRRSITTILYEEQKKKDKVPPVEIVYIQYRWSNKE